MTPFSDLWKKFFPPEPSPHAPPGLHPFQRTIEGRTDRIHLRVDPSGHGTLLINANRFLHLNPTAASLAYRYLSGAPQDDLTRHLREHYQVDVAKAAEDVKNITLDLEGFIESRGEPFYAHTQLEVNKPFSQHPQSPYRMDLAITYRCNNDCPHCYNARDRTTPELDTESWSVILDRLWDLAIPHVVFTGGEPTLREDLPTLINQAESRGQITGLNTNGRRLADATYVKELVDAGLDHVQITVESHHPQTHDRMVNQRGAWEQTTAGLQCALESPLYVMTNTTMLQNNRDTLGETLDFLAGLGVPTVGLNALIYAGRGADVGTGVPDKELAPTLQLAKEKTQAAGQRLIWYTPTQYCRFNPLDMGLGVKGCTAALYNMCIEPNGDVLPCQSYYQALGNITGDSWQDIWHHPLAVNIRERRYAPQVCQRCQILPECGGGCPLAYRDHQPVPHPEGMIPRSR